MKHFIGFILGGLALALLPVSAFAQGLWSELMQPGSVILFRHATAPGIGDPANFTPFNCSTQRNLSGKGRAEASKLGDEFRRRGIEVGAVLTSQWCRARETARLAFGDVVRDEPAFNSTFQASGEISDAQTAQASAVLAKWHGPGALIVFTHQVNITALTGIYPASAQGVVLQPAGDGSLKVLGTISP